MAEFEHITTEAFVEAYEASEPIFEGLIKEVRELSRKKPEATMSPGKVKIVNRVLGDLLTFLKNEPDGKYLEELDDTALPQVSDAVLVMVQFETALKKFKSRYFKYLRDYQKTFWITAEFVDDLGDEDVEVNDDES